MAKVKSDNVQYSVSDKSSPLWCSSSRNIPASTLLSYSAIGPVEGDDEASFTGAVAVAVARDLVACHSDNGCAWYAGVDPLTPFGSIELCNDFLAA
jgi:hypothetical protein